MTSDGARQGVVQTARRPAQRVFLIETFTLRFDAQEDRLRLDATDKAGRLEGIWMTQRLTNKLVAALAQDLDRELAQSFIARTLDDPHETTQAERPATPPKAPPPQVELRDGARGRRKYDGNRSCNCREWATLRPGEYGDSIKASTALTLPAPSDFRRTPKLRAT